MNKLRLEAISKNGKKKFIEFLVKKDEIKTTWGYVDGKAQSTTEKIEAVNVGKKNEVSSIKQAKIIMTRKIKEKIEEGYVHGKASNVSTLDLAKLPKSFAPCKPIAKSPKNCLDGSYLAERKFNGVNIILVKDINGVNKIYSRRMDDITENLSYVPAISVKFDIVPNGTMFLCELVYFQIIKWPRKEEHPELLRGLINKTRSKEDSIKHYKEITENDKGEVACIVFDVMFWDNKFVGDMKFIDRRKLYGNVLNKPFNKEFIEQGRTNGWEGFILRKSDSKISYSMDGKPIRTGSYKFKFEETDDFIVVDAVHGKGKHAEYFARFKLAQYDKTGELLDCGFCGPGKLTIKELKELYKDRSDSNGSYIKDPIMVVEVLYRSRAAKGIKLEFPVLQRIRDDKPEKECMFEE